MGESFCVFYNDVIRPFYEKNAQNRHFICARGCKTKTMDRSGGMNKMRCVKN